MKNFRKWMMLALIPVLIAGFCASAESAPADGLYTIGVSSSARMFRVVDCVLRVEDGRMEAVLTLSGKGYGYVFAGTSAEADAAPVESWIPFDEDWNGDYTYTVEIPALDQDVQLAGYSTRYSKWYDRTLRFFSNTLTPHTEIAPDGVYAGRIASDTALNGAECILCSEDGKMQLELPAGDAQAMRAGGQEIEAVAGEFAMQLASLDLREDIELMIGGEWISGWLKMETDALQPHAVTVADGTYRVNVETDSGLLRFSECILTVRDGGMIALLTAKNNNFDYLYQGLAKDAPGDEAAWISAVPDADGAYTYIMEIPSLDNTISVATFSAKKKMWYDRTILLDSASLEPLA